MIEYPFENIQNFIDIFKILTSKLTGSASKTDQFYFFARGNVQIVGFK